MNGFLLWQLGRRTQKAIRLSWLDCSLFSSRWIYTWVIFSRRFCGWILYYNARDEFSKVGQHARSLLRSLHLLTRIRLPVQHVGGGCISEGVDARWERAVRKWRNVHVEREQVFFPHNSLSVPEALLELLLCLFWLSLSLLRLTVEAIDWPRGSVRVGRIREFVWKD